MTESTKLASANTAIAKVWQVIQKNLPIALLLLGAIITVVIIQVYVSKPQYRPLYLSSERFDTSEILNVLDDSKISYQIDPVSGRILVDQRIIAKTRMLLASKGVEGKLPVGLELLVENAELGTSQFVESARYRHGLEGEIAQTIMSLSNVNSARVHLALPDKKSFIRKQNESVSASVFVDVIAGHSLSESQVAAIMTLVSGSIPELTAEDVTVVDAKGVLLSADVLAEGTARKGNESVLKAEEKMATKARHLLLPIFGADNVRVTVAVEMNFDRIETTSETVLPDPIVRNEKTRLNITSDELAVGVPGSLSNRAPNNRNADDKQFNESSEAEKQYAVSSQISHVKHQIGKLEQLNVAVLLNSTVLGENWAPTDTDELKLSLTDALGLVESRGDTLTIITRPFADITPITIEKLAWWKTAETAYYVKVFALLAVALLLIQAVVRPIVKQLLEKREGDEAIEAVPEEEATLEEAKPGNNAINGGTEHLPPAGSPLEVQLHHLQKLSDAEPERVSEILRSWINETNR